MNLCPFIFEKSLRTNEIQNMRLKSRENFKTARFNPKSTAFYTKKFIKWRFVCGPYLQNRTALQGRRQKNFQGGGSNKNRARINI